MCNAKIWLPTAFREEEASHSSQYTHELRWIIEQVVHWQLQKQQQKPLH
uniref:Uncharacterized protein n=1 Tax=Rhizophora mucronata TaxID=61149 RepID=A0A2P2N477_RHIMU